MAGNKGMIIPHVLRLPYLSEKVPQTIILQALTTLEGNPISKVPKLEKPKPEMTRVPKLLSPPFGN